MLGGQLVRVVGGTGCDVAEVRWKCSSDSVWFAGPSWEVGDSEERNGVVLWSGGKVLFVEQRA